jgi:hypothetical protein
MQALKLLQRLAAQHPDPAVNTPIRQQIKMIASIVNPQEWHASGKLSRTELRLLESYNSKPVLMRPCQRFYRGKSYLVRCCKAVLLMSSNWVHPDSTDMW